MEMLFASTTQNTANNNNNNKFIFQLEKIVLRIAFVEPPFKKLLKNVLRKTLCSSSVNRNSTLRNGVLNCWNVSTDIIGSNFH